jgi:hypothetical protein
LYRIIKQGFKKVKEESEENLIKEIEEKHNKYINRKELARQLKIKSNLHKSMKR